MTKVGTWVITAGSGVSLALAIFNFFSRDNGIHGSGGALLVLISTALILAASLLLALNFSASRWLRITTDALVFLGIVVTIFANYMLEANLLFGVMVLVLIVWFVRHYSSFAKSAGAAT